MSSVRVNTSTYSTTHVATGMLRGLKLIITEAGLNPAKLSQQWPVLEAGVATWLGTGHLRSMTLEVCHPQDSSVLVGRFDFDIDYGYYTDGDGDLWLDPQTIRQAVRKAGTYASGCGYDFIVDTAPGRPDVAGWTSTAYRSTAGTRRMSLGTAVGGGSLGASLSYYGKA